jgi:dTDP-4-amino-4,6-dideoxygalactose transaminase
VTVPFFPPDLFEADRQHLLDLVREVGLDPAQRFILGARTAEFERLLGQSLGGREVVACGSGTSALTLVLHAMGVAAGDEVVVPAFGCAPLAASVVNLGATPVFADIDPDTLTVAPDEVERAITPRTRVLMPAHIFSIMADVPRLRRIADEHGVRLLEDSAVAQGAVLDGVPAGCWGDAGVFSFVQVKSFGMPGEGGAVVTRDPALAARVRMLRNHGQDGRHRFLHHHIGYNSRFDELLAAFQIHRLPTLPQRLERRAAIAEAYTARFRGLPGVQPPPPGRNGRCHYVYSLLVERRDALRDHLAERGIGSHAYYPRPLPAQPAFAPFAAPDGRWPNAERACTRSLAIPIHPNLTDEQVHRVADAVVEFASANAPARSGRLAEPVPVPGG